MTTRKTSWRGSESDSHTPATRDDDGFGGGGEGRPILSDWMSPSRWTETSSSPREPLTARAVVVEVLGSLSLIRPSEMASSLNLRAASAAAAQ